MMATQLKEPYKSLCNVMWDYTWFDEAQSVPTDGIYLKTTATPRGVLIIPLGGVNAVFWLNPTGTATAPTAVPTEGLHPLQAPLAVHKIKGYK